MRNRIKVWCFDVLIRLNIFDTKNFLGSLLRENFLRSILDPKVKYMRRLLEDFALGGKPKFY